MGGDRGGAVHRTRAARPADRACATSRHALTAVPTPSCRGEAEFVLSLVLPKGSLEQATLDLFDAADLSVRRGSDRDYHAAIDDPRIGRVRFLRPQEIPQYVEQGLFDLGITGRDWIAETDAEVVSLGELQYSKATGDPVRVVLAVPKEAPWHRAAELPEGIRISTEFPALTRRYLDRHGVAQERAAHPGHAAHQLHRADRESRRARCPGEAGRHGGHPAAARRRGAGPPARPGEAERGGRGPGRRPRRDAGGHVADADAAGHRRALRGRGGGAEGDGEHADPGAQVRWRFRHPGAADLQDRVGPGDRT